MILSAQVDVACDNASCDYGTTVHVALLRRDAVEHELTKEGWTVRDGKHYCEDCAEEMG